MTFEMRAIQENIETLEEKCDFIDNKMTSFNT